MMCLECLADTKVQIKSQQTMVFVGILKMFKEKRGHGVIFFLTCEKLQHGTSCCLSWHVALANAARLVVQRGTPGFLTLLAPTPRQA